jgi:rhodanese-related sulfurtransferase
MKQPFSLTFLPTRAHLAVSFTVLLTLILCFTAAPLCGADKPKPSVNPKKEQSSAKKEFRRVGVKEFDQLRGKKNTVVLDVRTKKEFNRSHIPGAVNLDFYSSTFEKQVAKLDKSKTYLVHCAGGVRSAKACAIMKKLSFPALIDLKPGFRAWEKADKPVKKEK